MKRNIDKEKKIDTYYVSAAFVLMLVLFIICLIGG